MQGLQLPKTMKVTLEVCDFLPSFSHSTIFDAPSKSGNSCWKVMEALVSKILISAWHDLPCADFGLCPEGQSRPTTTVIVKPFLNPFVSKWLKLCNDIESNPGPRSPNRRSNSKNRDSRGRSQQGARLQRSRTVASEDESDNSGEQRAAAGVAGRRGRRGTREGSLQRLGSRGLESRHDVLEERVGQMEEQILSSKTQADASNKIMDQLVTKVSQIDGTVNDQDNGLLKENAKLKDEIQLLMKTCKSYEDRFVEMEAEVQGIKNQMNELSCVYDDLQDRLYEIDRSWQNNLVFHGIKPDPGGVYESMDCLESKIKGVLRTNLNIGRDIPIVRIQRIFNGSDVRGYKPVIVNFQKWSDKEDVLRKAKILKTSGIYVEEDFSRAAKYRRKELEKFAKEVKALSPEKKCVFKHDKLIIDDHVYIYNDQEHRIERLPSTLTSNSGALLEDEVGDAASLARRLRQKQQQISHANFNANAKRAQSVESMLDRIPNVGGGISPHSEVGHTHHGMSSSISSYNVGSTNGTGGYSSTSPERKTSKRVVSEADNDADIMDMSGDDNGQANN